jgi:predicted translin family RNA/ssDNA-binding protein
VSSPEDLLQNVRVYIQNDSNSSISYGIANGDSSIFPLCQQIFNEHQHQQEILEGKFFRFTFRTINDNEPHEIQMKSFVYLNYFHLQLIHIIGELNWSELIPCLSQTIDLAERFDSTMSNFGLRNILQQLFNFDPPAVTFQHVKRIAFQYLVDYLMHGVKNELVKQSIESANPNPQQVIKEIIEY